MLKRFHFLARLPYYLALRFDASKVYIAYEYVLASFVAKGFGTPEQLARAAGGLEELLAYLDQVIDAHQSQPRDNLISALVAVPGEGSGPCHGAAQPVNGVTTQERGLSSPIPVGRAGPQPGHPARDRRG